MPNLPEKGVSEELFSTIQSLFQEDIFKDFRLGGGTSLAIKYNHRLSVDIDLFTPRLLGYNELKEIVNFLNNKFDDISIFENNFGNADTPKSEVAFIQAIIPSLNTKIELLQNIPFLKKAEVYKGIPLVHDDDIGSMKLLAAADRGTRKDFVDLVLLTNENSFKHYFEFLLQRAEKYKGHKNLFDQLGNKPSILTKNLTPLANFNKAADEKVDNNKLLFTENSSVNIGWFEIKTKWEKRVQEFAVENNIPFEKTQSQRVYKRKGFSM
ncbi:MAG: nucleotidyl transferase AbiEii/AbiGii toxin family protein [Flavobacteriales bacterium]|nr:nucleotidyl transferase AbiEii/AbiGii toxin family protein [Flavobacteriales bacterium]MCB9364103.1 nucleotidyl transferase AbiEii/AbiGii toxin family protein [Flavobacteriales bacterium]